MDLQKEKPQEEKSTEKENTQDTTVVKAETSDTAMPEQKETVVQDTSEVKEEKKEEEKEKESEQSIIDKKEVCVVALNFFLILGFFNFIY